MLPATDTAVTYPSGATVSTGTALHSEPLGDGRSAVILDVTSAHPVDSAWPDQPADRGTLVVGADTVALLDCVVGATDGEALYLAGDIPVRKGTEGWAFVVAHVIDGSIADGATVEVRVDADFRHALSAGHTACHLASLALNSALADAWTKEVPLDGLGHPNFDSVAIESSTISENGSVDLYRIGKSLRKRGFTVAALDDLGAVATAVNARLAEWVATDAAVTISRDGDGLTSRREWRCELPGHPVSIPCGGTHLGSLSELASITIGLATDEVAGAVELRMMTTAVAA